MDINTLNSLVSNWESTSSPVTTIDGKPIEAPIYSKDADTLGIGKDSYRIQGFNAPEVAHIKGGIFVPGQSIDDRTVYDVNEIARLGGFTDLKTTGKDVYGRTLAEQVNPETGATLGQALMRSGYLTPDENTKAEDVSARGATKAAVGLFGTNDPMLRRVAEAERDRAEKGLNPIYKPQVFVQHTRDYAAFKQGIGVGAAAKEAEEAARLQKILDEEDLMPETRARLQKKLEEVQQNIYAASTTPDFIRGVYHQPDDRNVMNEATNQFMTSLKGGLLDMQKMFFGTGELIGDSAKWDMLSSYSKDKVREIGYKQGDMATTLSSFKDISSQGGWETIADTATYVGNLTAGTLPMMAALIGSTAMGNVGAIPVAALYAGGFYAEQPEDKKNAALAVAMGIPAGVLDRLGLEGLLMSNSLFTMAGKKEVVEALMAKRLTEKGIHITREAAEAEVESMTKKTVLELAENASEFAAKQYASKEALARGLLAVSGKAAIEGSTEVAQTAAELLAASGEWSTDVQYERDFTENLLNAAVGGGTLGGAFATVGNVRDAAEWHSIADRQKDFDKNLGLHQTFAAYVAPKYFDPADPNAIRRAAEANQPEMKPSSDSLTKPWYKDLAAFPKAEGAWNAMKAIFESPGRLIRQHAMQAIPEEMLFNAEGKPNENLGILKAIMGGYGILPGDHYSAAKQRRMGRWSGGTAEELATALGVNVTEANTMARDAWINYWSKGKELPATPANAALMRWRDKIEAIRGLMEEDLKAAGLPHGEVLDASSLFNAASIDARTLTRNRATIESFLMDKGASKRDAKLTVDGLLSKTPEQVAMARNYAADLGLFSDPKTKDLFENNLFTTIENLKDHLSTRLVSHQYLGENGQTLSNLLNRAYQNGELTDKQLEVVAKDVKDWYDITMHQYHPLTDYPRLEKAISWGTTLTMLAFLGKAGLSSKIEVATSMLGTPAHLIKKQWGSYWNNFFKEAKSDINKMNSAAMVNFGLSVAREMPSAKAQKKIEEITGQIMNAESLSEAEYDKLSKQLADLYQEQTGRTLFERLGYAESGFNTQSKFEYADSNQREAMHRFATVIMLRAQTDSLRMAALAVASDIAIGKLMNLSTIPPGERYKAFATGQGLNRGQAQDLADLMSWGMNVEYTLSQIHENSGKLRAEHFLDPDLMRDVKQDTDAFEQHILSVIGNMVDSKVMNPQAHNLPKYYHDPRLRVLTAMQRFMATSSAVLIPKLYIDYIKNGNAGMRYQAFSIVAMTILAGFFVNGLKDQLSYGEDSPYVEGVWKNMQRALYSSGMLGQFERVVDMVDPLYDRKITNPENKPLKALWDVATGLSPVAAWTDRPVRAVLAASEGDTEQAVKQAVRGAPLLGSFPVAADVLSSPFKKE